MTQQGQGADGNVPGDGHVYESLGLLIAGALTPAERVSTEDHLRMCTRCTDELIDVVALPGLLGRLVPAASTAPVAVDLARLPRPGEPAPGARARLVAAAQAERHRVRRWRQGLALVAAAVVVPLIIATVMSLPGTRTESPPAPALAAMARIDPAVDVAGSLAAESRPWGTEVIVRMRWAREAPAVLVAVGLDGREQEAGWWSAPAGKEVLCRGATSMQPDQIARWEVRSGGKTLLTLTA